MEVEEWAGRGYFCFCPAETTKDHGDPAIFSVGVDRVDVTNGHEHEACTKQGKHIL